MVLSHIPNLHNIAAKERVSYLHNWFRLVIQFPTEGKLKAINSIEMNLDAQNLKLLNSQGIQEYVKTQWKHRKPKPLGEKSGT